MHGQALMVVAALGRLTTLFGQQLNPPFEDGASKLMHTACSWQTDVSGHHPIGPGLAGGVDSPPQASATACEKWCCETSHMQTVKPKQGDAAWKFTEEAGGSTPRQCDFWAWKEAPANDAWTKGCWVAAADYVPGQVNPPCPGCGKGNGADGTWIGASKCLDPVRIDLPSELAKPRRDYVAATLRSKIQRLWPRCVHLPCPAKATLIYGVTMRTCCAQGGSSWGRTFLLWLAIATCIYTVGGTVYGSKVRGGNGGRSLGPLSAHPHAGLWLEVGGLTADGLAFARGGGKSSGGTGYQRKQNQLLGGGDNNIRQRQRDRGRKAGKQRTERSRGKQKRNEQTSEAAISPPENVPVLAAPGGASLARGNGKGGSWVHVPN